MVWKCLCIGQPPSLPSGPITVRKGWRWYKCEPKKIQKQCISIENGYDNKPVCARWVQVHADDGFGRNAMGNYPQRHGDKVIIDRELMFKWLSDNNYTVHSDSPPQTLRL